MPNDEVPSELIEEQRAKLLAEAKQAEAIAERNLAETKKLLADARTSEAAAVFSEISLEREKHQRAKELAADEHFLFYPFNGSVGASSVNHCINQLSFWMRTKPGEPIEVQFNSPGGDVVAGLALWDFLARVKSSGHHLTTSAIGYAASMAGILLQAGDTRAMGKESWLMIHEASFGASGKMGEVEDTVEWVKMIQERFLKIFAERSNMSVRQLRQKWSRKDWWIPSDEALDLGLVDEIR